MSAQEIQNFHRTRIQKKNHLHMGKTSSTVKFFLREMSNKYFNALIFLLLLQRIL